MNVKSEFESSRTEKVAVIINNNRKYLIIAAVAILVILAAIGAVEYMSRQKAEKSLMAAEVIQEKLKDYMSAADEDKGTIKEELKGLIDSAKTDYPHLYAHMRALDAEAELYADSKDWDSAADSYTAVAEQFPKSYLAPVALMNAAAMKEQNGDLQAAFDLFEKVVTQYKTVSPDIPEALFNLGRLSEGLGNKEKAQEYYSRISDEYSSSSWNNLAKSRIIAIKAGN